MSARQQSGWQRDENALKQQREQNTTQHQSPVQDSHPAALQRAVSNPHGAHPGSIQTLQRLAGNRAVQRLLDESDTTASKSAPVGIQARLMVGPVGDAYEQEADRVAKQVVNMPSPAESQPVQRAAEEEELQMKSLLQRESEGSEMDEEELQMKPLVQRVAEEEELQMKPLVQRVAEEEEELQMKSLVQRKGEEGFEAGVDIESRLNSEKGGGNPLPGETRDFMESRFGADFSSVRVHTGSEAVQMNRDLQAQAFAHGSDIFFGDNKYDPGSTAGKELLAHELTHVVQQGGAASRKEEE